jgi:hypothetical protein
MVGAVTGDVRTTTLTLKPNTAGVGKLTLMRGGAGVPFLDLYAVVGDAQSMTMQVRVNVQKLSSLNPNTLYVQSVDVLSGEIKDLFDFDFDVTLKGLSLSNVPFYGSMARAGAMLQAAYGGAGGTGGMVFQNVYQLGGKTLPGFAVGVGP